MINRGLVSVVVPIYNGEKFISSLIDNFDRQTYKNFELILVNDCSPDGSRRLIREMARNRPYIKCIDRETNGGMGPARNSGIDVAVGEYLIFIDQDDSFSDNYIQIMKYIIDKDNADIAVCNFIRKGKYFDQHTKIFDTKNDDFYILVDAKYIFNNAFAVTNVEINFPLYPWCKIVKKSLYNIYGLRFPDIFVLEDTIILFKELCHANYIAIYNSSLYYYNISNIKSTSVVMTNKIIQNLHLPISVLIDYVKKYCQESDKQSAVLRLYFSHFIIFCLHFYNNKYYNKYYDTLLLLYHKALPCNNFDGNEFYIYFQMQILYIMLKKYNRLDLFVKFIKPYRYTIKNWLTKNIFSKSQKYFLVKFLTIKGNYSKQFNIFILIKINILKTIRYIYKIHSIFLDKSIKYFIDKIIIFLFGYFNSLYFKETNKDININNNKLLDYYVKIGWKQNRNPNKWFDVNSYLQKYPDVKRIGINPLIHFIINGFNHRKPF